MPTHCHNTATITAVIPARYASVRFPGKPLCLIHGREMILRVCDQAQKLKNIDNFLVATDHQGIYELVRKNGFTACLTAENHPSGTDRILEALQNTGNQSDFVLNIQGDEPFFIPADIDSFILDFITNHTDCVAGTIITPIHSAAEVTNPNVVKVTRTQCSKAIYFSRSPIPFFRELTIEEAVEKKLYYRHIGVYLYQRKFLNEFSKLPASKLEQAEKLEQLRILENGYPMAVFELEKSVSGIDTPQDLADALRTQVSNF